METLYLIIFAISSLLFNPKVNGLFNDCHWVKMVLDLKEFKSLSWKLEGIIFEGVQGYY